MFPYNTQNSIDTDKQHSLTTSESKVEQCKSHKEAERRRRQRINAHLSTLRSLLPNTTKTDKASLLAEVVHQVKELRKQADDVARKSGRSSSCTGSDPGYWPFPGETDEFTLGYCDDTQRRLVKATLCCEDRPGLNRELNRSILSVGARAVRFEMMTVGGRTKRVMFMEWAGGRDEDDDSFMRILGRALKDVMENRASTPYLGRAVGSKRARVCGLINASDADN